MVRCGKRRWAPALLVWMLASTIVLGGALFAGGTGEGGGQAPPSEHDGSADRTKQRERDRVDYPVSIEDDSGPRGGAESAVIVFREPVDRIVVGEKGCALALKELGALDRVVAASDWIVEDVPGYESKTSIGRSNVDVELIIGLAPDVFVNLAGHNDRSNEQLVEAGISVYTVGTVRDLDHIKEHIREYGLMLDEKAAAEAIVREMEEKERRAARLVSSRGLSEEERPTVFMFGPMGDKSTLQTWAPSGRTIVEDLIVKAGGRCLTAEQGLTGWPQYSLEKLLESDPDVIILPMGEGLFDSVEEFVSLDVVRDLSAVKEGRVYGIEGSLVFDLSYENATTLIRFAELINR